jgi:predicted Zn-dependent peptidase
LRFSGLTTVTARLDPANLERAETAVLEVLRRVRDEGVSDAELRRAIISAESLYAFDNEPAEGRARTYGLAEVTSSLAAELHYLSRLRQDTTAQVQAAARAYFGEGDYARVRLVPRAVAR